MRLFPVSLLLFALTSCAHQSERSERRASQTSSIAKSGFDTFTSAPNLSPVQRELIMQIFSTTASEAMSIKNKIAEKKTMLFRLASSQAYESSEIKTVTNEIAALDLKRLEIMFQALKDVQEVVGYGPERLELYEHLRNYDQPIPAPSLSVE